MARAASLNHRSSEVIIVFFFSFKDGMFCPVGRARELHRAAFGSLSLLR
jgi:hypothetical protein